MFIYQCIPSNSKNNNYKVLYFKWIYITIKKFSNILKIKINIKKIYVF